MDRGGAGCSQAPCGSWAGVWVELSVQCVRLSVQPVCYPVPLHGPQTRPSVAVAHEVAASVPGGPCAVGAGGVGRATGGRGAGGGGAVVSGAWLGRGCWEGSRKVGRVWDVDGDYGGGGPRPCSPLPPRPLGQPAGLDMPPAGSGSGLPPLGTCPLLGLSVAGWAWGQFPRPLPAGPAQPEEGR